MSMSKIYLFFTVTAVLAASAAADLVRTTPPELLKKREVAVPAGGGTPPPFEATLDAEQQEYVKAHNDLRRQVGVPPLEWSADLTREAHAWAEQRVADCGYRNHSTNKYGENISWSMYKDFTPTEVVQRWFNESRFYNQEKHVCNCQPEMEGCECGHYLAVIWSTTKRVGCSGAVYCDGQQGLLVVCNYDPAASLQPGVNPLNVTE